MCLARAVHQPCLLPSGCYLAVCTVAVVWPQQCSRVFNTINSIHGAITARMQASHNIHLISVCFGALLNGTEAEIAVNCIGGHIPNLQLDALVQGCLIGRQRAGQSGVAVHRHRSQVCDQRELPCTGHLSVSNADSMSSLLSGLAKHGIVSQSRRHACAPSPPRPQHRTSACNCMHAAEERWQHAYA